MKWWLVTICILGFILRYWQLDKTPLVNRDELAIGYNAYSILLTGKDEHGIRMPLSFRSFSDYKLPGLIYSTVLPIKLFGLSVFSIRFINALLGTLTVVFFYLMLKQLELSQMSRLISTALLSISPWHIHGSRSAYEPITGLFWSVLGYVFLFKSRKNFVYILGFLLTSVVGSFFYNAALILSPLSFALFLFSMHNLKEKIHLKHWLVFGGLIMMLSIYWYKLTDINMSRVNTTVFSETSINNKPYLISRSIAKEDSPYLITRIFQIPYFYQINLFIRGYLAVLNPEYIWFDGGNNPWHNLSLINTGNMLPVTLPMFVIGLYAGFKRLKLKRFTETFLIGLLFLTPITSAITIDSPNTNRLLDFHLLIIIFCGLGLSWLKESNRNRVFYLLSAATAGSLVVFAYIYFGVIKDDLHPLWNSQLNQAINELQPISKDYPVIHISSPGEFSYIYSAFFTPFDPADFQKEAVRSTKGMEQVLSYRQYRFETFTPISCYKMLEVSPAQIGETEAGKKFLIRNRFGEPLWKATEVQL